MQVAKLTIDSSKVSGDQTDYIVYVDLSDLPATEFWDTVANGGGDIRCYKSDGTTELAREVVSCDTSTETGELHVKYSGTLSSSVDTEIQIHADGTSSDYAVTATYGRNNVWSDYELVLHMRESSGSPADSTGNHSPSYGGNLATYSSSLPMGGGQDLDGSADEITIATPVHTGAQSPISIQMWVNLNLSQNHSLYVDQPSYSSTGHTANYLSVNTDGSLQFDHWLNSGGLLSSGAGDLSTNTNHLVHLEKVGTGSNQTHFYVDGSNVGTGTHSEVYAGSTPTITRIGTRTNLSSYLNSTDGLLGSFRLRHTTLSSDWITTEYNNQNSASTFYAAVPIVDDVANSSLATWELEEASGTRVDSHGTLDLTDTNTVGQGTGKQGSCADFTRANTEYLYNASSSTVEPGSQDWSMGMWVNFDTLAASTLHVLISGWALAAASRSFTCRYSVNNTQIEFQIRNGSNVDQYNFSWTPTVDTWYYIGLTWEASAAEAKFYVNGTQTGGTQSGTYTSSNTGSSSFALGAASTGGDPFDGLLDEVSVWKRVLSPGEISALYNSGSGIPYEASGSSASSSPSASASSSPSPSPSSSPSPSVSSSPSPSESSSPSSSPSPSVSSVSFIVCIFIT